MAASISVSVLMPAKMPELLRFASTPPLQHIREKRLSRHTYQSALFPITPFQLTMNGHGGRLIHIRRL